MSVRFRTLGAETGSALVLVVFLAAALVLLSVSLVDLVQGDSTRSARGVTRDAAFQAAEAGLDDYTSKLLDDNQYYLHDVALGESTRRSTGGQLVSQGTTIPPCPVGGPVPCPIPWAYGTTWTYPNGKNVWRPLSNGYEYNIQVTGPNASQQWVDIVATGRKQGTTSPTRVVEQNLRPASVADFQMIANADITYGSTATTYGKIYAGIDSHNVRHSVTYDSGGKAYANVYAESQVYGSPMVSPAKAYDSNSSPTIRTVIKQPINFASFASSLSDIQRAAGLSGLYLDNTSVAAWRLVFTSAGNVTVQGCKQSYSGAVDTYQPSCTLSVPQNGTFPVPVNGAIYAAQAVIVSWPSSPGPATVNGRLTVASNNDVVIGGNIGYAQSGDDVLGLIAKNDVIVAKWASCPLDWRAATVAQTGQWRSASSSEVCHNAATFTGSSATNLGGYMNQYATRVYNYDSTLSYLQPPWFPTIDYAYTVLLFRELPPG